MNFGPVDYSSPTPPPAYHCHTCKRHGCKLWREYQTFADHTGLYCCDCAGEQQKKDVSTIDAQGKRTDRHGYHTDQIGWLVPAVPTAEGDTFWGYLAVPSDGVAWWRALPTRVEAQRT